MPDVIVLDEAGDFSVNERHREANTETRAQSVGHLQVDGLDRNLRANHLRVLRPDPVANVTITRGQVTIVHRGVPLPTFQMRHTFGAQTERHKSRGYSALCQQFWRPHRSTEKRYAKYKYVDTPPSHRNCTMNFRLKIFVGCAVFAACSGVICQVIKRGLAARVKSRFFERSVLEALAAILPAWAAS